MIANAFYFFTHVDSASPSKPQSINLICFEILNYSLQYRKKIPNKILGAAFKGKNYNKIFELISEQLQLLDVGVPTFDSLTNDTFNLRCRSIFGIYDLVAFADVFYYMHSGSPNACMLLTLFNFNN